MHTLTTAETHRKNIGRVKYYGMDQNSNYTPQVTTLLQGK